MHPHTAPAHAHTQKYTQRRTKWTKDVSRYRDGGWTVLKDLHSVTRQAFYFPCMDALLLRRNQPVYHKGWMHLPQRFACFHLAILNFIFKNFLKTVLRVWVCECATIHMWRSEVNLQGWSSPSTLFAAGSVVTTNRLAGLWALEDPLVSVSHLLVGALNDRHRLLSSFTWVLGTQTHSCTLVWQMLYLLSNLPSPTLSFWWPTAMVPVWNASRRFMCLKLPPPI